ncbi:dynein intermediate chain 2, ciliary isoform X2 [Malaya genurostris]|uniref:dynein intermediate chain 2, ciliary isoform X2 n=1 Tax=Malaya genurostris TaxID=325434 RepID=UPI0026F3F954|nr:dynein intermediate chain 2, ciliary isoform X2 [Malaya genurostris]XP_058447687.1 dynein intermediate chain 2, ciliary isoform X2 [Malaya genurostris]XP_058447688.1 dynein intermediate chain 2, ciliary isoform X2 [Malaya genurostris]XP_058447689.1 dynein intermediate chain 2, ciliary isoform X2 [Malaya genurostris]
MPLKSAQRRPSHRTPSMQKLGKGEPVDNDEFESWVKAKQLLKPDDQLDLTEAELGEEVPKLLSTENRHLPRNLVIFNFHDGTYVPVPPPENTVTLLEFEGTALHKETPEAKEQIARKGSDELNVTLDKPAEVSPEEEKVLTPKSVTPDGDETERDEDETEAEAEAQEQEEEVQTAPEEEAPKKKLTNQFNFCERAALTIANPSRAVDTQTIPPPRSTFGASVLQWVIYDSYAEDYAQQQREKEREKEKKPTLHKRDEKSRKDDKAKQTEEFNKRYLQACQIIERMVNQNIYDEIAQDYRYWEDPSDEFREEEGTLLPLWKFSYEKTKKMCVTDLCFNTLYYDLFAVCFGTLDFMKQGNEGAVCLFTIKNPSFPDYRITTESGAMCCDIHPKYPYLIAIGLYDGNVIVYNLQVGTKEPVYMSHGVNGKHSECVWELKWGPDMQDGEINFYSVSGDGRVFNWVLMQNKLAITTIISLFLDIDQVGGPDGSSLKLKGCGMCMVFHPNNPEIFLVGTEEGYIFKCSTAYSSKYLMTYYAHYLSVHRMDYNKFNSNIFASCSGDWRVKIWEDMRPEPLFIFDLGASVGDVKWAPYSSTVFAAVTTEGKVFVFDLNVNKYKAICIQAVVSKRKNKLSRLAFNHKLPFIIVGDDKGTTITLKLSPNLRIKTKAPKKAVPVDPHMLEVQKLDRLLSLVRELPEGEMVKETVSTVASN